MVVVPPPCPEPTEEMLATVDDLPEPWFFWLRDEYDPYCDSIYRARKVSGADDTD